MSRTCPTIMPIFFAQLALVCSSVSRTVKPFLYINTRLQSNHFGACRSIVASLITYSAVVRSSNRGFGTVQCRTGSSVMTLFSTDATDELPINQASLQFWTVVSPMPLPSTVSAVKLYACIEGQNMSKLGFCNVPKLTIPDSKRRKTNCKETSS